MKKAFLGWLLLALCSAVPVLGASTFLYQTKFEQAEGYDPRFTLAGQRGWVGAGTGGSGLLDAIPDYGQSAYIGFHPPTDTNEATSVWSPVNFNPPPTAQIVKFSVLFQINPSATGGSDEFRWAVYNRPGDRLFSIDFFTKTRRIYYELQDRVLQDTGWEFALAATPSTGLYELDLWLDFGRNTWSAFLNGYMLVHGQKIATLPNIELNLGDVDAVWAVADIRSPGNNYMVFDNYEITSESASSIPALLESLGKNQAGHQEFRIYTQPGVRYSVDVTADLRQWFSLAEFTSAETMSVFEDTTSKEYPVGFYRVRGL